MCCARRWLKTNGANENERERGSQMRTVSRFSGLALRAGAALAMLVWMGIPVAGQALTGYKAPRLPGTEHPDLNGVYESFTTANWDLLTHAAAAGPVPSLGAWFAMPAGLGVVEGNEIPYQPWALKKKQENFTQRLKADPNDPGGGDLE